MMLEHYVRAKNHWESIGVDAQMALIKKYLDQADSENGKDWVAFLVDECAIENASTT